MKRVDIVIKVATVTPAQDFGSQKHERRVVRPLVISGSCRREVQPDDISEQRRAPAPFEGYH